MLLEYRLERMRLDREAGRRTVAGDSSDSVGGLFGIFVFIFMLALLRMLWEIVVSAWSLADQWSAGIGYPILAQVFVVFLFLTVCVGALYIKNKILWLYAVIELAIGCLLSWQWGKKFMDTANVTPTENWILWATAFPAAFVLIKGLENLREYRVVKAEKTDEDTLPND